MNNNKLSLYLNKTSHDIWKSKVNSELHVVIDGVQIEYHGKQISGKHNSFQTHLNNKQS